ncbi:8-oxo-dGTP diphosphatase [Patescibacteria group bacterium]
MKNRPTLVEYKKSLTAPLRRATLCFLVKDDQVLLAMKKRGFAEGKWNGVGGKVADKDESVEAAATREIFEEIGVTPKSLRNMATLNSYFLNKPEWGQQVTIYIVKEWGGEPKESEEMRPRWFNIDEIPFDQMWEDERLWLPQILNGLEINISLLFDENQKLLEQDMRKVKGGEKINV